MPALLPGRRIGHVLFNTLDMLVAFRCSCGMSAKFAGPDV